MNELSCSKVIDLPAARPAPGISAAAPAPTTPIFRKSRRDALLIGDFSLIGPVSGPTNLAPPWYCVCADPESGLTLRRGAARLRMGRSIGEGGPMRAKS